MWANNVSNFKDVQAISKYLISSDASKTAAILDAILDFSERHNFSKFMPAVSDTIENTQHFGI